jgi:hypothetical protein
VPVKGGTVDVERSGFSVVVLVKSEESKPVSLAVEVDRFAAIVSASQ